MRVVKAALVAQPNAGSHLIRPTKKHVHLPMVEKVTSILWED
jgi:hypothetical protein